MGLKVKGGKNIVKSVAESLGVRVGEVFISQGFRFKFTDTSLMFYNESMRQWEESNDSMVNFILGRLVIEKVPFTPKMGETYYYVDISSYISSFEDGKWTINSTAWNDTIFDLLNYNFKNVFPTRKDCERNLPELKNRFIELYKGFCKVRRMGIINW